MFESHRSVYDYVVYDSDTERDFAKQLEDNESVKVYAKLPSWFKVPTPLGSYNPDWAVVIEDDGQNKLYFVVEALTREIFVPEKWEKSGAVKNILHLLRMTLLLSKQIASGCFSIRIFKRNKFLNL